MSLTVHTEQRGDVVVVSVAGELDMATAPQLQDQITDLLDKGRSRLVFDLAEVSFCDSTGLSVFVRAKNSCDEAGGVVRLAAPQRGVLRILEVSGLVEVLHTYPTVEQAVAGRPDAGLLLTVARSALVLDVAGTGDRHARRRLHGQRGQQEPDRRGPAAGRLVEDADQQRAERGDDVPGALRERGQRHGALGGAGPQPDGGQDQRERALADREQQHPEQRAAVRRERQPEVGQRRARR